jgi:hypothetical protein
VARLDVAPGRRRQPVANVVVDGPDAGTSRRSLSDLVARGRDLSTALTSRNPSEHLVAAFQDRLAEARRDLHVESSPAA